MKLLVRLGQLVDKRIPPNARVDAADFSEAEFPVHCPECGYLLAGVPEPRCPECGRPFDRGRLLVEQYVLARSPQQPGTCRGWLAVLFGAKGLIVAVGVFTLLAWSWAPIWLGSLVHEYGMWMRGVLYVTSAVALTALLRIGLAGIGGDAAMNQRRSAVRAALKATPRPKPQP